MGVIIAILVDRFGFFNERFGCKWLVSCTVAATPTAKMAIWSLRDRTMIATDDYDIRLIVYILNLRIIIAILVDRVGFFNERFGREFFCSSAVIATPTHEMLGWLLPEIAMIRTNDRDIRLTVNILNF